MRNHRFGDVMVDVLDEHVLTTFADGAHSNFYPPVHDAEFCRCATQFGYVDPLQYGLEHDVTHNWLAHELREDAISPVVWAAAHGGERLLPAQDYEDEEHLVNRLQFYLNTGRRDDDYNVLHHTFGHRLPIVAMRLWRVLRG